MFETLFEKQRGELIREINVLGRRFDDLVLPESSPDLVSPILALPMLRGLWVTSVTSTGAWVDVSSSTRHLTYNGDPEFNQYRLVGYWDYDGVGDYHSRADELGLDITGTESYVAAASRGLTLGGWFWIDTYDAVNAEGLIGKDGGDPNRSYILYDFNGQVVFAVSPDGTIANQVTVLSAAGAFPTGAWCFIVGRFDPSTELALFVNEVKTTNVAAIPASIFNSTAPLEIGRGATSNLVCLDGRAALCFLCAAALSDAQISSVFNQTKAAFGV